MSEIRWGRVREIARRLRRSGVSEPARFGKKGVRRRPGLNRRRSMSKLTVSKILCPTDFSEASKRALSLAVPIAEKFDAEIYLVHVVPVIPVTPSVTARFDVPEYQRLLRSEAENELAKLSKSLSSVKTHAIVTDGSASDGILKTADEKNVDLIVIATAGATGWEHVVFGSVAEKVVRRARCPVLTVRAPETK
jgi:nucleotide-binding universal stress UspA family protein